MSWLAKTFANSLKFDDDNDEEHNKVTNVNEKDLTKDKEEDLNHQIESTETQARGVKEDLSEITKTLTRQLWGVASFLAPPPPLPLETSSPTPPRQIYSSDPSISDSISRELSDQSVSREPTDPEISDSKRIAGIRSDFAEIGGKFKTGISNLSKHKAVSEISKIASNFLPFGSSDENYGEKYWVGGAVGVTDEVLAFATNIAMHPETWLDFPLADDQSSDDFDMSDAQQEHALAVENLAPRLAALRMELCPEHMSEGCFWKIYFVLLHSRLNKHDAEVLSTAQIAEARALLMQEKTKPETEGPNICTYSVKEPTISLQEEHQSASSNVLTDTSPLKTFAFEPKSSAEMTDIETEKHSIMQIIDKPIAEEPPVQRTDEVTGSSKEEIVSNKDEVISPSKNEAVSSKDEAISASRKVVSRKDEVISASNKEVILHNTDEEDVDDWLEESIESDDTVGVTNTPLGNDEDVSFSDLEEDDDDETVKDTKKVSNRSNNQENKVSDDWFNVDEMDTSRVTASTPL